MIASMHDDVILACKHELVMPLEFSPVKLSSFCSKTACCLSSQTALSSLVLLLPRHIEHTPSSVTIFLVYPRWTTPWLRTAPPKYFKIWLYRKFFRKMQYSQPSILITLFIKVLRAVILLPEVGKWYAKKPINISSLNQGMRFEKTDRYKSCHHDATNSFGNYVRSHWWIRGQT